MRVGILISAFVLIASACGDKAGVFQQDTENLEHELGRLNATLANKKQALEKATAAYALATDNAAKSEQVLEANLAAAGVAEELRVFELTKLKALEDKIKAAKAADPKAAGLAEAEAKLQTFKEGLKQSNKLTADLENERKNFSANVDHDVILIARTSPNLAAVTQANERRAQAQNALDRADAALQQQANITEIETALAELQAAKTVENLREAAEKAQLAPELIEVTLATDKTPAQLLTAVKTIAQDIKKDRKAEQIAQAEAKKPAADAAHKIDVEVRRLKQLLVPVLGEEKLADDSLNATLSELQAAQKAVKDFTLSGWGWSWNDDDKANFLTEVTKFKALLQPDSTPILDAKIAAFNKNGNDATRDDIQTQIDRLVRAVENYKTQRNKFLNFEQAHIDVYESLVKDNRAEVEAEAAIEEHLNKNLTTIDEIKAAAQEFGKVVGNQYYIQKLEPLFAASDFTGQQAALLSAVQSKLDTATNDRARIEKTKVDAEAALVAAEAALAQAQQKAAANQAEIELARIEMAKLLVGAHTTKLVALLKDKANLGANKARIKSIAQDLLAQATTHTKINNVLQADKEPVAELIQVIAAAKDDLPNAIEHPVLNNVINGLKALLQKDESTKAPFIELIEIQKKLK
jgi:hypothetical protein